jgi:hypothetical protein
MPGRMGLWSAIAQVRRDHRSEMVHPAPNSFAEDYDPRSAKTALRLAGARLAESAVVYPAAEANDYRFIPVGKENQVSKAWLPLPTSTGFGIWRLTVGTPAQK